MQNESIIVSIEQNGEKLMFRLLIACICVAFMLRVAAAEGLYVKIYGGLSDVSFSENYGANNANTASTSGGELFYGGAFGGYINEDFSVEVAIERIESNIQFSTVNNAVGSAEATLAFLNGYYHLDEIFYIGAGIGGGEIQITTPVGISDADSRRITNSISTSIPYQAIVGFKLPITDSIDWDTSLRHLVIDNVNISSVSTGLRFNF